MSNESSSVVHVTASGSANSAAISGQLVINASGFEDVCRNAFVKLYNDRSVADCVLCCEEGSIKVHRVVLIEQSHFFENCIKACNGQIQAASPIIVMLDVPIRDLMTLVEFLYLGQVSTTEESLPSLLRSAARLKIKLLPLEDEPVENSESLLANANREAEEPAQANGNDVESVSKEKTPTQAASNTPCPPPVSVAAVATSSAPFAPGKTPIPPPTVAETVPDVVREEEEEKKPNTVSKRKRGGTRGRPRKELADSTTGGTTKSTYKIPRRGQEADKPNTISDENARRTVYKKPESGGDAPAWTSPQIHLLKVPLPAMKALQNTAMKFSNHKRMSEEKNVKKEQKDGQVAAAAAGQQQPPPPPVAVAAEEPVVERRMVTSRSAKTWTLSENKALVNLWWGELKKSKRKEVSARAITALLNQSRINKQVFQVRRRLIQLVDIYDSYDKEQQLSPSQLSIAQYMYESGVEINDIRDCKIVD